MPPVFPWDRSAAALDDVTLSIPERSFVAIMGPSGSGKTTMLNLITGVDHTTSGRVCVGNEEISGMNENELADWRARHIGLVFQFYNLRIMCDGRDLTLHSLL